MKETVMAALMRGVPPRVAARRWMERAAHGLEHHPRKFTAVLVALMLGGAGGAYAVADSLTATANLPPQRLVVEEVEPLPFDVQRDALQANPQHLFSTQAVRSSDTVDTLLVRLGVSDALAADFLRRDAASRSLLLTRSGRNVSVESTPSRDLVRLVVRAPSRNDGQFQRLVVERKPQGGFQSRIELAPYTKALRLGTGAIQSSLFAAMDEAGIPDDITLQMVDMFGGQVDFHRGLRRGDRFNLVYEVLEADGEVLRGGRVVTAEFANAGRVLRALWYQEPGEQGGYFDFDGQSLERQFLASPMEISRVTSGFAMRFHPIRQVWAAHKGVDYGAPSGTPVRVIANGRVQFAGWQNGYGNVIQVDHGRGDTTVYAHLSRVDVKVGAQVARGQRIGAVGATGWATGPHLHFEFKENGVNRDPLEVARSNRNVPAVAKAGPAFQKTVALMKMQLAAASTVALVAAK